MSESDELDRVWEIIEKVGVCMLTTCFAGGLRSRPLEARPDRKSGRVLFVTDIHSAKRDEVSQWPDVGLVFVAAADKAYLSITGRARVVDDPELRAAAWRKNDVVWWPGGPGDPDVCVLVCELATAELWDGGFRRSPSVMVARTKISSPDVVAQVGILLSDWHWLKSGCHVFNRNRNAAQPYPFISTCLFRPSPRSGSVPVSRAFEVL